MQSQILISDKAKRTTNPIRNIVDNIKPPLNHHKPLFNLALGDPTIHGNLLCPQVLTDAIKDSLSLNSSNGYLPSFGSAAARNSIAKYTSRAGFSEVNEDDVIIASGCSGALELVISVLLNEGDDLLVPKPGFPLYQVITNSLGGTVTHYPLLPSKSWECDTEIMKTLIKPKTKAILINNPSNPCGSNFSVEHLEQIVLIAKEFHLPIIADEIYGGCVFDGEFTPIYTIAQRYEVPVLSVGGLAKEFIVPGWRVGWITIHDAIQHPRLIDVRGGLKSLTQLIVGANSLIQAALPRVLVPRGNEQVSLDIFKERYMAILKNNAKLCVELARDCPELTVVEAKGAMYTMIHVNISSLSNIVDDADFCRQLLLEENMFILPGICFGVNNYVRLVICPSSDTIREAFQRLINFIVSRRSNVGTHDTENENKKMRFE